MRRRVDLFFAVVLVSTSLSMTTGAANLSDGCTLDEVIFGEQLLGPAITEDDCRGRVTLFFTWGIT